MSEKLSSIWRKIKDYLELVVVFGGIALLAVAISIFALLVTSFVTGFIISLCWNIAMPVMFGFSKITLVEAVILALAIGGIRSDYFGETKAEYGNYKKEIANKCSTERKAKILTAILILLIMAISIGISVITVMYSWNSILPHVLNVELVKINFIQALCFTYVAHRVFGVPKSNDSKNKKDNSN